MSSDAAQSPPAQDGAGATKSSPDYSERLTAPWWSWPAAFAAVCFLAAELAIGFLPLRQPLTFIVACAVAAVALLGLGRIAVSVRDGQLRVDDARLPVRYIGAVEVIDLPARRDLLGVDADPLAFVVQRPWISGGVRVDLDDPADPTPYWYISSRHPQRLVAALMKARDQAAATSRP